ncbi:MAG: DUF2499 domain-containing protein [Enterocloster sp.]
MISTRSGITEESFWSTAAVRIIQYAVTISVRSSRNLMCLTVKSALCSCVCRCLYHFEKNVNNLLTLILRERI